MKMAAAFVLLGSVLGFLAGLAAWLAFDASFIVALAIWMTSGPLAAVLAVAASSFPGRADATEGALVTA